MRRASWLVSALVLLLVVGCKPNQQIVGGVDRTKRYTSVASLSPSTTEIVASTSFATKLVGRTAACNFPLSVVSGTGPQGAASKGVPIVAGVKPDYEKLKAQNPGLIAYDANLYSANDVQKIDELGIDTFAFKANTVEEYVKELYRLGSLLGAESSISTYVDNIVRAKGAAEGDPITPKPKAVIMMAGTGGRHMIAGTKSFQADLLRIGGAEPLGPDSAKFEPANPEAVIAMNPDTIVVAGDLNLILNDSRFKAVNAVKNRRVFGINQDVLVRKGYRVDKAIQQTHEALVIK